MTYEQLAEANKTIDFTDIKGKNYAEVSERIRVFRMLFPNGRIDTGIPSINNGVCIFHVSVYDEEGNLLSTGTASEKEDSSFINKTSYVENCETSAVGRALGMLGIGVVKGGAIASAEEEQNAEMQQAEIKTITIAKVNALRKTFEKEGIDEEKVLAIHKLNRIEDMTERQHSGIINNLKEVKVRCGV